MKLGPRLALSLFGGFFLLGCSNKNPAESHGVIQAHSESPPVSEKVLQKYPPSLFLYGVGRGDSEQAAIELARADVAKKIRVRVTAAASDVERGRGEQSETLVGRLVATHTDEVMNDIQIVELRRDLKTGLTQAVVIASPAETDGIKPADEITNAPYHSLKPTSTLADSVWVAGEGRVPFGPDTTLAEAGARSRDRARRRALERAVGTFVKGQTVVYNSTVAVDTVHSTVRGIIIEEEILEEGVRNLDKDPDSGALFYMTRLRAKVKPIPNEPQDGLRLEVELNRTVFHEGDEVQIAIVPSRDAFIYILNVGQDDHVTMVFPNKFADNNFLVAQREFIFPDDVQREMGIRLRTALPPGEGKSIENIKVLATSKRLQNWKDQQIPGIFFEPPGQAPLSVTDLMKWLTLLEDTVWAETTIPYEVRR